MSLELYLLWACQLFILGLAGILSMQNNVLFALIAIEIMLLASGVILAISSSVFLDGSGQMFVLFILTVAAAESAVGLALLIRFYKIRGEATYFNVGQI